MFRVQVCLGLGFRCLGFRCLGFRCLGFRCSGVVGVSGVLRCSLVFSGVSQVFSGVLRCSQVFSGVLRCSLVFLGVLRCLGVMTFRYIKRVTKEGARKWPQFRVSNS